MNNDTDRAARVVEWRKLCRKINRKQVDPRNRIERTLDIEPR